MSNKLGLGTHRCPSLRRYGYTARRCPVLEVQIMQAHNVFSGFFWWGFLVAFIFIIIRKEGGTFFMEVQQAGYVKGRTGKVMVLLPASRQEQYWNYSWQTCFLIEIFLMGIPMFPQAIVQVWGCFSSPSMCNLNRTCVCCLLSLPTSEKHAPSSL